MTYELAELTGIQRQWLLHNSNIPRRFLGTEPKDIQRKTGDWPDSISDWIDAITSARIIKKVGALGVTGVGLLFDGEAGMGKTTHAVTAIMEVVRQLKDEDKAREAFDYKRSDFGMSCRPVYYMTFPEFLSRKKALIDADPDTKPALYREMEGFHGRAKEDYLNVRLLVLDDLGKEYGSNYDNTSFDEILRARYDKGLPTIVTTNVYRDDWAKKYGDAMGSFVYEAFIRVALDNGDLRKGKK